MVKRIDMSNVDIFFFLIGHNNQRLTENIKSKEEI